MDHLGRNQKDQSWTIICDRTKAEELKYKLCLRLSDGPSPFLKAPFISMKGGLPSAVIYCNMADSRNETEIRKSAEFIRKRIDYPFAMLCYETDRNTRKRKTSFLHTPDGELYRDNGEELELVPLNPSEASMEKMVLESSKAAPWPGQLPSQVTDQEYLYLPPTEEGKANMMKESGGKWMLYSSRSNMDTHDGIFLAMVTLFQKGILVGLKAATAMPNEGEKHEKSWGFGNAREVVLISCYTANSEDEEDVFKAAQAIRSVLKYGCIIYYKTNSASIKGYYHHKGKMHVTKYMHTVGGGFYERDEFNRFKLV